MKDLKGLEVDTRLAHLGRDPDASHGYVNVPPFRASTHLYPTLDAHDAAYTPQKRYTQPSYARIGTPTSHAFEDAVADIEGGYRAIVASSGLGAVTTALLACLKAGDHLLMIDTVYGPTRRFCDTTLAKFGVETVYFDPAIGGDISTLMRPNTKAVFVEAPGSLTFEMADIPAIAAVAHRHGAQVLMDNTWATGLYFKSFAHGVDISIHAATKYLVGHSDAMLGVIVCTQESWRMVKDQAVLLGQWSGPDDVFLGLRGLRTLSVRLERHWETGLELARWLSTRPEVAAVRHPALPGDPGHAIWQRDFLGACGLFAVELHPVPRPALAAMLDGLRLFGMGASWGGFESLILPQVPPRTAVPWSSPGPLVRIHAGLEAPKDLIADLTAGFERMAMVTAAAEAAE